MNRNLLLVMLLLNASLDAGANDAPVQVTITEVVSETLTPKVPAAGTVHSRNAAQITAGLDAQLQWVAEPGAFIPAGQPVARFECAMLELQREEQLAQARREELRHAALAREIARYERAELATSVLQVERVRADRDLAGSDIEIAMARVRRTESQLRRCVAPAPFSGVVTGQLHRGGEDVARGTLLATMTDVINLEVRAAVPIRHLPRMRHGAEVAVRHSDMELQGILRTVVPAANAASQTFEVRVDLPADAASVVAAGQLVSVHLPLAADAAIIVPRDAIVLRSQGAFVMRIDDANMAEPVRVEVADGAGERVSIRGDLAPGDRIAVRGAEALEAGRRVAVLAGP